MKKFVIYILVMLCVFRTFACPSRIKNNSDSTIGIAIQNKSHRIPVGDAKKSFELTLEPGQGMAEDVTVDPSKNDPNNHTFFIYKKVNEDAGEFFEAQYKIKYLYCGTGVNKTLVFTYSDKLGVTDQNGKPLEAPSYKAQFEVTLIEKRCPSVIKNVSEKTTIAIADKKIDDTQDTTKRFAAILTPGQEARDIDPSMHEAENRTLYVYKKIGDSFEKQYSISFLYCAVKENDSNKNKNKNLVITYSDEYGITDEHNVSLEAPGSGEQFKVDAYQVSADPQESASVKK